MAEEVLAAVVWLDEAEALLLVPPQRDAALLAATAAAEAATIATIAAAAAAKPAPTTLGLFADSGTSDLLRPVFTLAVVVNLLVVDLRMCYGW